MPKVRETCTRCSRRRQKCDRKIPCTRCIESNQGDSCSREWRDGYNPHIHRSYPKSTVNRANLTLRGNAEQHYDSAPQRSPLSPASTASRDLVNTPATADHLTVDLASKRGANGEKCLLQNLLPSNMQILHLLNYHETSLLWYHNAFHAPTLREEVSRAINASPGGIQINTLDMRWCALLFATMAASLTCVNDSSAQSWGFNLAEKKTLSRQWYNAATKALNLGDYTSKPHINSIQAIVVMSLAANFVGFPNEQFILYGAACRIAQVLGLQRVGFDPQLDDPSFVSADVDKSQRDRLVGREIARRIWSQLCVQDWLSIPFSGMCFIQKKHFTSIRARRLDDVTLLLVDENTPVRADFGHYVYDIASLMAEFHDAMTGAPDTTAQFEVLLRYDAKLRAVGSCFPSSFSEENTTADMPPWVPWARRTAGILFAHRIITMHRSFLERSFTDPTYSYSRWASLEASRLIVTEFAAGQIDEECPNIWSCQAHLVWAGITLCLDLLHRARGEPKYEENRHLVNKIIGILEHHDGSNLASRGLQILSSLLKRLNTRSGRLQEYSVGDKDSNNQAKRFESAGWPLEDQQNIDAMLTSGQNDVAAQNDRVSRSVSHSQYESSGTIPTNLNEGEVDFLSQNVQYLGQLDTMQLDDIGVDRALPTDLAWLDQVSDFFPGRSEFDDIFLL